MPSWRWFFALAVGAVAAMSLLVATSSPAYPTPSDSLWAHLMPRHAQEGQLMLNVVAAALFATAAAVARPSRRLFIPLAGFVGSGVLLFFLSVLIWRLASPASLLG